MFVHLHSHSAYSFLRGVASPEELVVRAAEEKMPAVALTDTNGMYAAVPFYQAAQAAGVKPILGVVLDVEWSKTERGIPRADDTDPRNDMQAQSSALVLLAADAQGYSNLCRLVTCRQLAASELRNSKKETRNSPRDTPVLPAAGAPREEGEVAAEQEGGRPVTLEELAEHSRGVMALAPLERTAAGEQQNAAATGIARLNGIFGERLYLEVRLLSPGDRRTLREAERFRRELGVPLAATNNVHFLRPGEHLHHRVVNAIRTGGLLTTVQPPDITSGEAWFKPAAQMERLFADYPEAARATLEIAERCNVQLELGKTIFPEFPAPEGETPFSYLSKLSFDGARARYRLLRPAVLERLAHELAVIEKLNLAPYFLLVWEIVEEARRRGIPAVVRGSAASSMVVYCLGISRVCPLRWGLYFERFLNEQRGDCPDMDIDICGARRDDLLDYVYRRWGAEHVAMIGSFITMHARLAVREVAKVFGVPPEEVNRFTRRLPHRPVCEILEAIRTLPECRLLPVNDEPWKTILNVALRLDGAPRHLGIHPCGTVIAARPLAGGVPLERAAKGIVVTQYDMNAIEVLGLIKMDLLGQRGLTTMSLALDNIERANPGPPAPQTMRNSSERIAPDGETPCPQPRQIDFEAVPENDPATCDLLAQGRTMGIFQIESPGMRGLLRALHARTLEDMAAALALIRPGASEYGSKELFLKRLRGQVPVTYAHAALRKILGDTLGVCIYQEQVMQIAQAIGEMSLAEADLVRRSSAKFSGDRERERLRGKFLKAAEKMGLAGQEREETWQMVEKFAGFGFCKAHAATYADISYRMAYLKAHHPAEFLAAMCSAGAGFYHVSAYVEEAKRWGIEVRLPSVNRSRMEYTTETRGPGARPAMRVGLMQVKGLRLETLAAVLRARQNGGEFRSLEDFLHRVPAERDEIEALVKCGAFDEVTPLTRPALLWQWNLLREKTLRSGLLETGAKLFPDAPPEESWDTALEQMHMPDYSVRQKLAYEREILEVCVSGHPLDGTERNAEVWSDELESLHGQHVTLLGWMITFRHVGTKHYRNMMFVTLEDQHGLFEAVLFPEAYERYGGLVFESRALRVTGRVETGEQINCESLEAT
jgi:DNA-directed DNA polymerase III PolC